MAISTNGTIITRLAGALYGEYLSNATYDEVKDTSAATVAADWLKNDFAGKTDAQLAATILKNTGLSGVAGLDNYVIGQLANAPAGKGAKIVEMLNFFAGLSADATWGSYATAFNAKVAAGLVLSQTAGTTGGDFATAGTAPVSGGTFALTTGADVADGTSAFRGSLASTFKFTSGNETLTGTVGTLGADDVLVDGSSTDSDTLSVSISAASGAFTSQGIETIAVTAGVAGAGVLNMTNVAGANTIKVSGNGAFGIDELTASTQQPTIELNSYTRNLTIAPETLAGTTKLETAEKINLSVSGATYGKLASTQTTVTLDADETGTLEELNITSAGTAANELALVSATDLVGKINLSGATALTVRATEALVSGVVVTGAAGSNATLNVNRDETSSTVSLNAANFSGVKLALSDSTAGSDDADVASLKDGSTVVLLNDFVDSSLDIQGALYTALANSVTVTLDNSKDATDVDVSSLAVQNVKALTINSNGFANATTAVNSIGTVSGDFSTITINGDTPFTSSFTIDGVQSAAGSTGARAVTVTAAGMTGDAFVELTANGSSSTYATFTLTGTANDDTLTANALGSTLNGGAGNDILTGGNGNDVINGGDGDDEINVTFGTDKLTGGAGDDTYVIGDATADAVAQVSTFIVGDDDGEDGDDMLGVVLTVTVAGVEYSVTGAEGDDDADLAAAFVAAHAVLIETNTDVAGASAEDGIEVTATGALLTFTGRDSGASFTLSARDTLGTGYTDKDNNSATSAVSNNDLKTITAGSASKVLATSIVDFSSDDIIQTSLAGALNIDTADGLDADNIGTANFVLMTDATYATVALADAALESGDADGEGYFVFINSTTGKAQLYYDADLGDNEATVTLIATFDNITSLTGISTTFSDTSIDAIGIA